MFSIKDDFDLGDEPSFTDDGGAASNRTLVYPFTFDKDIMRRFDIGSSGAYLDCKLCHVHGDVDLVIILRGSIKGRDFGIHAFVAADFNGKFDIGAGLKGKTLDDRVTLWHTDLTSFEMPGLFEVRPSVSVYGFINLTSEEDITFTTTLEAKARNFKLDLLRLGKGGDVEPKLQDVESLEIVSSGTSYLSAESKGSLHVNTATGIIPDLEVRYKFIGQPRSRLEVGILNGVTGSITYTATDNHCRNHASGELDAKIAIFTEINNNRKILKESNNFKLLDGCLLP